MKLSTVAKGKDWKVRAATRRGRLVGYVAEGEDFWGKRPKDRVYYYTLPEAVEASKRYAKKRRAREKKDAARELTRLESLSVAEFRKELLERIEKSRRAPCDSGPWYP